MLAEAARQLALLRYPGRRFRRRDPCRHRLRRPEGRVRQSQMGHAPARGARRVLAQARRRGGRGSGAGEGVHEVRGVPVTGVAVLALALRLGAMGAAASAGSAVGPRATPALPRPRRRIGCRRFREWRVLPRRVRRTAGAGRPPEEGSPGRFGPRERPASGDLAGPQQPRRDAGGLGREGQRRRSARQGLVRRADRARRRVRSQPRRRTTAAPALLRLVDLDEGLGPDDRRGVRRRADAGPRGRGVYRRSLDHGVLGVGERDLLDSAGVPHAPALRPAPPHRDAPCFGTRIGFRGRPRSPFPTASCT